jgi:hypothetical protein
LARSGQEIRKGSVENQDRDRYPGLADPDPADPDWYQFQAHVFFTFFPEHFNMLSKILKIMTPFPSTV